MHDGKYTYDNLSEVCDISSYEICWIHQIEYGDRHTHTWQFLSREIGSEQCPPFGQEHTYANKECVEHSDYSYLHKFQIFKPLGWVSQPWTPSEQHICDEQVDKVENGNE